MARAEKRVHKEDELLYLACFTFLSVVVEGAETAGAAAVAVAGGAPGLGAAAGAVLSAFWPLVVGLFPISDSEMD